LAKPEVGKENSLYLYYSICITKQLIVHRLFCRAAQMLTERAAAKKKDGVTGRAYMS